MLQTSVLTSLYVTIIDVSTKTCSAINRMTVGTTQTRTSDARRVMIAMAMVPFTDFVPHSSFRQMKRGYLYHIFLA